MSAYFKKILFAVAIVFCALHGSAQNVVEDLRASIAVGNVNGIARYFDNSINLNIAGSQASYSRPQAEMVLRDFFNKNSPKKLDLEHSDASRNMRYAMGTLMTSSGNFRIYFALKQKENYLLLQELRIER